MIVCCLGSRWDDFGAVQRRVGERAHFVRANSFLGLVVPGFQSDTLHLAFLAGRHSLCLCKANDSLHIIGDFSSFYAFLHILATRSPIHTMTDASASNDIVDNIFGFDDDNKDDIPAAQPDICNKAVDAADDSHSPDTGGTGNNAIDDTHPDVPDVPAVVGFPWEARGFADENFHNFLDPTYTFFPKPDGHNGINDWAQNEADCVSQKLNETYQEGRLSDIGESPLPQRPRACRTLPCGDGLRSRWHRTRRAVRIPNCIENVPRCEQGSCVWWKRRKQVGPREKNNPKLAAEYAALGKKYDAQDAFRLKWAKGHWGNLERERTKTVTLKQSVLVGGQFEPPNKAWDIMGRGHMGLIQMKNLALMCNTIGNKFCSWNSATKCLEIMVTKKGFREELETAYAIKTTQKDMKTGDVAAPATAVAAAPAPQAVVAATPAPEVAGKKAPQTPRRLAKGKSGPSSPRIRGC